MPRGCILYVSDNDFDSLVGREVTQRVLPDITFHSFGSSAAVLEWLQSPPGNDLLRPIMTTYSSPTSVAMTSPA